MPDTEPLRHPYPEISPYDRGRMRVSELHEIYYEQYGNPNGKPALFVHGGPGGGTTPAQARFWDPSHYRIVLFDQRGCGKSTPHAELRDNGTWQLVSDMEALRERLGIERWQVFGGSWGSTLALAYAEKHPERVSELVLRGIFLLREREIQWFYQDGASRVFPEAFEHYLMPIPEDERGDLVQAYHRRLTHPDPAIRLPAAKAWSTWEAVTSTLRPSPEMKQSMSRDEFALAFARIECHYFVNKGFFARETQLLDEAYKLANIPGVIVQGRYDIVCPMETAWALHKAWPQAQMFVAQTSGHSAFEPEIIHHLIAAT
ncbi:MAG TPA: prolyl aminopeptidase, partial [Polyangiales bacterium]|nr:prolyl aminopeptidase [Polyangiales bacterium]